MFTSGGVAAAGVGILYQHGAPVSRDVPRQFPLPYGWDCSVQDHRYEPKQRPAGSDHHGRRMAQQSPSLLYICQDGFLLVGSRHLLLRPELAFALRYCLGHEEAEPTSFGNCKNLKHTLQPVSLFERTRPLSGLARVLVQKGEPRGQHANHLVRLPIDGDGSPDDGGIAAKLAMSVP